MTGALKGVCLYYVLLLIYDGLSVAEVGVALEGTYNMVAFLLLDVGILGSVLLLLKTSNRCYALLAVLLTAVYALGEVLGYPIVSFCDWVEFTFVYSMHAVLFTNLLLRQSA